MEKPYIQFSKMENGSFLEPHKDAANKIFTLIFYFPSKDWILNNSREGGTKIYEFSSQKHQLILEIYTINFLSLRNFLIVLIINQIDLWGLSRTKKVITLLGL